MTRPAEAARGRVAPARTAAYDIMRAVGSGAADLPHALARARARLPDERDRALAGEIAVGTLRWQGAFDRIAAEFTRRPITQLDPEVVDILRITIFQLLHLDRVPASAAVSDAVSLAKKVGKTSAAPLVNAVLRRVSRKRDRLPLPRRPTDDADRNAAIEYLSVTLSHPRWLAERWLDRYGFEAAEAWLRFNNSPAPLTIRINGLRTTSDDLIAALASHGVIVEPGRYAPGALVVTAGNPLLTPLAGEGFFFVQDEASQLVARLVEAGPGDRVLDACASPGGKTVAIADAMGNRGLIVASDARGKRIDLLARTITSSGASSVRVVQADAGMLPFAGPDRSDRQQHIAAPLFDWVLLDAPCSGLGTLRRDPDLKWRRVESDLPTLAAFQLDMLSEAGRVLRPGGRLIYATCSSEPEENEHVVARFLKESGFAVDLPTNLPAQVESLIDRSGHLRTYPFRDRLEAFFGAVLRKPV